ncbi:hypothetical protein HK104_010061 [Borealophlyctis nickersoniae]|nr:hypothetical protein HK104_010061 [Borealophlyctis nickersoniae]
MPTLDGKGFPLFILVDGVTWQNEFTYRKGSSGATEARYIALAKGETMVILEGTTKYYKLGEALCKGTGPGP